MASSKQHRFMVGPEHVYWPVNDSLGKVVALCPNHAVAHQVAAALERAVPKPPAKKRAKRRSKP